MKEVLYAIVFTITSITALYLLIMIPAWIFEFVSVRMYKHDVIHYWHNVADNYIKEKGLDWDCWDRYKWKEQMEVWIASHYLVYYKNRTKKISSLFHDRYEKIYPPEKLAVKIFNETVIKDEERYIYDPIYALRNHPKRTFWDSFHESWFGICIVAVLIILLYSSYAALM